MPNHIKNKIELDGSLSDLNSLINQFGTLVKSSIIKTHDDNEMICEHPNGSFCWFDPKTGRATNRSGLDQIGLPDGFEFEINDQFLRFPDFAKVIPPPDDPAYRDEPNQEVAKQSPNWWYKWNVDNWGTKWGSYSCKREAINIFTFETAWSSVPDIIEKISLEYPKVKINYSYADEDTGSNCGKLVYLNGLVDSFIPDSQSNEAYEIAIELRPELKDSLHLVDGKYKWIED